MRKILVTTKKVSNFFYEEDVFSYHFWNPSQEELDHWAHGGAEEAAIYCLPPRETIDGPDFKARSIGYAPGVNHSWTWYRNLWKEAEIATGLYFVESFSTKDRPALTDQLEISTGFERKRPNAPKPPRLTTVPKCRYKKPVLRLLTLKDLPPVPIPKSLRGTNLNALTQKEIARRKKFENWYSTTRVKKIGQQKRFLERVNSHREAKFLAKLKIYEKQLTRYATLVRSIEAKNDKAKVRFQRLWASYERSLAKYERYKGSEVVRVGKGRNYPFNQYTKFHAYTLDNQPLKTSYRWRETAFSSPDYIDVFSNVVNTTRLARLKSVDSSNPADQYKVLLAPFIESCEAKLVAGYYDRLGDQRVHFGNMLAERKQTIEMLASIYTAIVKLVMAKRSIFKLVGKALSDPKFIADQVLKFQFGLRPLWNDLMALLKTFEEVSKPEQTVHVKRAVATQVVRSGPTGLEGRLTCAYTGEYSVIDETFRDLNRWGLLDPSQIFWEVTPWSFVVDWLIPVGNFIASCQADQGLTWKRGVFAWKFIGRNYGVSQASGGLNSDYLIGGDCNLYIKRREVLLVPPSNLEILSYKNPFTINHTIDALALLVQGLRR